MNENVIEAILFAAGEPVAVERLCVGTGCERPAVEAAVDALALRYEREARGIRLVRMEDSVQLTSAPDYAPQVRAALEWKGPPGLSQSALEVLAIVAHRQPVTRAYIEQIRGVDSSHTVGALAEKGLIEECGRLDVPGRPALFRTSQLFLRVFGLKTLDELPPLPELDAPPVEKAEE